MSPMQYCANHASFNILQYATIVLRSGEVHKAFFMEGTSLNPSYSIV